MGLIREHTARPETDEAEPVSILPAPRPSDWESVAVGGVIAIGIGLVTALSRASDLASAGGPRPLWIILTEDFTSVAVIILLQPFVLRLLARFPVEAWPRWRWLIPHALATVPFSLAHVVGMGVLRWLIMGPLGSPHDPLSPLGNWLYEYRKDALSYAAIIAFSALYWAWRRPHLPRPAPARNDDAPIEIRDGARRFFVRPSEILWIEAAGNYAEVHLAGKTLLQRASLSGLEARLAPAGFARIHRARLVNRAQVAGIATNAAGDFTLTLRDGATLGGSRRYRASVSQPAGA
jgi:hypothetical protein